MPVRILSLWVILLGCGSKASDDRFAILGETEVEVEVVQVERSHELTFDVRLTRNGLTSEGSRSLTAHLDKSLRPRLMYVSEVSDTKTNSGRMCDRPRVPHRCAVSSDKGSFAEEYRLKILFEDQKYATAIVPVPLPMLLPPPTILAPTKATKGEPLSVSFLDVRANEYTLQVLRCVPYDNDGINPCLDEDVYQIHRVNGALELAGDPPNGQTVGVKVTGLTIELTSSRVVDYQSELRMEIQAKKTTTVDGVEIRSLSAASTSFPQTIAP